MDELDDVIFNVNVGILINFVIISMFAVILPSLFILYDILISLIILSLANIMYFILKS